MASLTASSILAFCGDSIGGSRGGVGGRVGRLSKTEEDEDNIVRRPNATCNAQGDSDMITFARAKMEYPNHSQRRKAGSDAP